MGTIYVVGIGPGKKNGMTGEAWQVLEEAEVIVGYKTYIDLLEPYLKDEAPYRVDARVHSKDMEPWQAVGSDQENTEPYRKAMRSNPEEVDRYQKDMDLNLGDTAACHKGTALNTEEMESCQEDAAEPYRKDGYSDSVDPARPGSRPAREFVTTGMRQELERCRLCYEYAAAGKRVALVCSGDAGVYGMASPMFELQPLYPDTELVVIPGVTAANSGAAILGAPLNHDYCVISLSDLLTPWEQIARRLRAAIAGDFAIAIYNPASHKRKDYLAKAVRIMLEAGASPERACGYVENIGRAGTRAVTCMLEELAKAEVNMFTTVIIGNEDSYIRDGRLITKRGYDRKSD